MSHHRLTARPGLNNLTIAVGWDRPMRTFFAQVVRDDGDGPSFVLWIDEISNAREVIESVAPYAEIPVHLYQTLSADSAHEGERRSRSLGDLLAAEAAGYCGEV